MLKRWAKIHTNISSSESLSEVFNQSPVAASLFMMAVAACDAYGRLPGNPVLFRARVCPRFQLADDDVRKAFTLLAEAGMVNQYTIAGKDYIELVNYLEWQQYNWSRIGKPEYPPPPDWQPPHALEQFVLANAGKRPFPPDRYGIKQIVAKQIDGKQIEGEQEAEVDVEVDIETTTARAREGELETENGRLDIDSEVPLAVQRDTGRPYDPLDIAQVIEKALPENVWRELKSIWSGRLTKILNADTEPLTLTDIYGMLRQYPPTLDQRWPEGWLRQTRVQAAQDQRNITAEEKHRQATQQYPTGGEILAAMRGHTNAG